MVVATEETMSQHLSNASLQAIFSLQNLRRAWIKTLHNTRLDATYYDRFGFEAFAKHLEANFVLLRDKLIRGEFAYEPLHCITMPKGIPVSHRDEAQPVRELYYPAPETALVLQTICDYIGPQLEQRIPPSSYANRLLISENDSRVFYPWRDSYGKYSLAVQVFASANSETWYHRSDISKFYPNIDKGLLLEKLSDHVGDSPVFPLLQRFVRIDALHANGEIAEVDGLPAGVPICHLLANVYLIDLDAFMEAKALAYFRYVDDLIFFAEDQLAIIDLQRQFEAYLAGRLGNLQVNKDKCATHPASETTVLQGVLNDISETLKLSLSMDIPAQQKQEIGNVLYSFLVAAEDTDDPSIVAKHAALAISHLKRLGYREDLSNIAYRFLRAAPLKAPAVRVLVSYLLQRNVGSPSGEFIDFVNESYDYVKIAFLQALRPYDKIHPQIWDLVASLLDNKNVFVRGEAAIALSRDSLPFDQLQVPTTLAGILGKEGSDYLKARAVKLSTHVLGPLNQYVVDSLNSDKPSLIRVALTVIEENPNEGRRSAEALRNARLEGPAAGIVVDLTYSVLAVIADTPEAGTDSLVPKIKPLLAQLSDRARSDLISVSVDEIFRGEVEKLKVIKHLLGGTVADVASTQQARLDLTSIKDGQVFFLDEYRQIEPVNRISFPDYSCYFVEDDHGLALLEIVRIDLILSAGFRDVKEWKGYLEKLDREGIISLIKVDDQASGNCVVIYRIPEGYSTLRTWFREKGRPFRSLLEKLQVVVSIDRAVANTHHGQFFFVNVHGEFVMCSGNRSVKFLALGSSLVAIPQYLSVHSNRLIHEDIGFAAYSKFLGLVTYELITDSCPIESLERAAKNPEVRFLSSISQLNEHPIHIRAFLIRTTHDKPDYRYESHLPIAEDLNHVIAYLSYLEQIPAPDPDKQYLIEFVDYIRLRLRTHLRNPKLNAMRFSDRIHELLRDVSLDFCDFTRHDSVRQEWFTDWIQRTKRPRQIDRKKWRGLSPTSRHLLRISSVWNEAVQGYRQMSGVVQSLGAFQDFHKITSIILAEIVRVETLAHAQAVGRFLSGTGSPPLEPLALPLPLDGDLALSLLVPADPKRCIPWPFELEQIEETNKAIQALSRPDRAFNAGHSLTSLRSIALFVAVTGNALNIYKDGNFVWSGSSINDEPDPRRAGRRLDIAVALVDFERILVTLLYSGKPENDGGLWKVFTDVLQKTQDDSLATRLKARVTHYRYARYDEGHGEVEYTKPSCPIALSKCKFVQRDLIDPRDIVRTLDREYPARVDIIRIGREEPLSSVLVRSLSWFPGMAVELSLAKAILLFFSRKCFILALLISLLLVSLCLQLLSETFFESQPVLKVLTTFVASLVGAVVIDYLKGVLNLLLISNSPEQHIEHSPVSRILRTLPFARRDRRQSGGGRV